MYTPCYLSFIAVTCDQAFARLSAVYGGTYMLNKPECKVIIHTVIIPHPWISVQDPHHFYYSPNGKMFQHIDKNSLC